MCPIAILTVYNTMYYQIIQCYTVHTYTISVTLILIEGPHTPTHTHTHTYTHTHTHTHTQSYTCTHAPYSFKHAIVQVVVDCPGAGGGRLPLGQWW